MNRGYSIELNHFLLSSNYISIIYALKSVNIWVPEINCTHFLTSGHLVAIYFGLILNVEDPSEMFLLIGGDKSGLKKTIFKKREYLLYGTGSSLTIN